jgi:hypothetical protein
MDNGMDMIRVCGTVFHGVHHGSVYKSKKDLACTRRLVIEERHSKPSPRQNHTASGLGGDNQLLR